MAVTLHSRLPFHLSRGDQERETSRLSLRHGRRRTSLVDDRLSSPFIADEINKRRRVSDRTFLSFPLLFHHFFPPFCLIIGSKARIQDVKLSLHVTTPLWSCDHFFAFLNDVSLFRNRIQGERFKPFRYDSSFSISFLFFFILLWNIKTIQKRNETKINMEIWTFCETDNGGFVTIATIRFLHNEIENVGILINDIGGEGDTVCQLLLDWLFKWRARNQTTIKPTGFDVDCWSVLFVQWLIDSIRLLIVGGICIYICILILILILRN